MWVLIARTSNSAVLATGGTAESLEVHCRAAGQRTRQRTAAFCFASLCCLSLSVCMRPVALFLRFRISLCNIECSNNCCDSATRGTRFRHARNARFRHANFRVPPQSWNDRNARFRMFRVVCSTVAELVFRHGGMRRKTSSGSACPLPTALADGSVTLHPWAKDAHRRVCVPHEITESRRFDRTFSTSSRCCFVSALPQPRMRVVQ